MNKREEAVLALADGTVFRGYSVGALGEARGEVVFNTSLYGYQEILTDPSYKYQLLTFTYPHIGNVGVNPEDVESASIQAAGLIVRELSDVHSNYRATESFGDWLARGKLVGIGGIDTRELVLLLREKGAQMGVIISDRKVTASEAVKVAQSLPSMNGLNLADDVSTKTSYQWRQGVWSLGGGYAEYSEEQLKSAPHCVAIDFGIKYNILRLLVAHGFRVTVVPARTTAEEIVKLRPDALFLSNGPGDPAAVTEGVATVKSLLGKYPTFGICLGHQILGLAVGARTFKLKFGHRGGNHPVRDNRTGKVEITVQNHGFAVDSGSVPSGVTLSHINLNDGTVEGLEVPELKAFSVQYHPESSPGPHDAQYLFKRFRDLVETGKII